MTMAANKPHRMGGIGSGPSKITPYQDRSVTLFSHPSGPLLKYDAGTLLVEDLNPQVKTQWRMNSAEMFALGWRCIAAAFLR